MKKATSNKAIAEMDCSHNKSIMVVRVQHGLDMFILKYGIHYYVYNTESDY